MTQEKVLILAPLVFYSPEDEELFFSWLNKLSCIKGYAGFGSELHVTVSPQPITFNEYKNFNGIFKRYAFKNRDQLKSVFGTEDNLDWFL